MSTPQHRQLVEDLQNRNLEQYQEEEEEREPVRKAEGEERTRLLEERPFDYIERTKPEDRLEGTDHHGQLTRDNVNPNIPSVTKDQLGPPHARIRDPGGIVDPRMLGMESQEGAQPPQAENQPEQWPSLGLDHTKDPDDQEQEAQNRQRQAEEGAGGLGMDDPRTYSINEPPGSDIYPNEGGPNQLPEVTPQGQQGQQQGQKDESAQNGQEPPELLSIEPDAAVIGEDDELTVMLHGEDFTDDCVVTFDGETLETEYISPTELSVALASVVNEAGEHPMTVRNSVGESEPMMFELVEPKHRETVKSRPKKTPKPSKKQKKRK